MNAVSKRTIPTKPMYFQPPSKMKNKDSTIRPNTILTIRSVVPTFAFKVNNSFIFSTFIIDKKAVFFSDLITLSITRQFFFQT